MRHLSEAWLKAYLQTVTSLFGVRLLFVGLQGSYGRDEATESSDIDMALILERIGRISCIFE